MGPSVKPRRHQHIAGITNPQTASPIVLDNLLRLKEGRPLLNQSEPARGC